ncbi:hypothetical protein K1T71_004997 [Dendrolimus kikuchii]|uniref:Uncharacterized protein n=1 Tax=Dendrolimus kikuchii TaxID=765133 RepID=A0ACC1D650_9NEOP|nr:hypothetical protein K1T71_004997 [Dendrolimus kikuchii]
MDPPSPEQELDMVFETVLYQEIGQFGKFQIVNILLLAVPALFSACMAGDYVFTAGSLPYRCLIPECDGPLPEYEPNWILNVIPQTSSGLDSCNRYTNSTDSVDIPIDVEDVCPAILFNRDITVPCDDGYVYERTNTVVYDFSLECQEWLRTLPGTLNSLGGMVALAIAGFVSDHYGRRTSIVIFSFNIALIGVVRAFSVNYPMYIALQFLQTAVGGGAFSASYILAAEIVGPKYRVITSATISSMFALGQVYLGLIAYAVPEWQKLSLVLFSPVFVLISYQWLLTESPRWLLSKNKPEKAKMYVTRAAKWNGKKVSKTSMNFLLTAFSRKDKKKMVPEENLFLKVIKSRVLLRRCCTTPILWITTVFIYYGLSINSVNLSGNMYINYIAVGAIEIPGFWTAVLVLDRIGRRVTLFSGFMVCALCNMGFAFTPDNMYGLSLFLFLTGKFCIGMVMTSLYLYTAELYPTRYRHSFLGFSSMVGRIGSVVSPLTPPLMAYWTGIPSMMFAGMALISALGVLTQPETLGLKVPDTIEEAEKLGKKENTAVP